MGRIGYIFVFLLLLLNIAGCDSDKSGDKSACVPGDQEECSCDGGLEGVQECKEDGSGHTTCNCSASITDVTTDQGTTSDAVSSDVMTSDATGSDATTSDDTGSDATGSDATTSDATTSDDTGSDDTGSDDTGSNATTTDASADPCDTSPCLNSGKCIADGDTAVCDCKGTGYEGATCEIDLDECAAASCDANATCTNIPGSFECACNAGWTGDGATCADIDECAAEPPCAVNATCTNIDGSFECACNEGWSGGPACDICPTNWSGESCNLCANAWTGTACDICPANWSGENCNLCANAWTGTACDICPPSAIGEQCDECANAWTGSACDICPASASGENCDMCTSAWAGAACDDCPSNWAGDNCDECAHAWTGAACDVPEGYMAIPAGTFLMGSPETEPCRDTHETQHSVTLTRSFAMKKTEVTQAEWFAVMGTNPSYFSACGDDCPVERVSWYDALAYCNKLSEDAGLTPCYTLTGCTGTVGGGCASNKAYCYDGYSCMWVNFEGLGCDGYRLPTEAEWEYAARAETSTATYNGDIAAEDCFGAATVLEPIAWYNMNSNSTTHPVGEKTPNAWGLSDTLGNVWEWTWDGWDGDDYPAGSATDPTGSESAANRVYRGGSWLCITAYERAAHRFWNDPGVLGTSIGFRPVRSLSP